LHGEDDTNVPPGESRQLYTALKILGKEVELIEIEDEKNIYFGVAALRTKGNTNFYPKYEITAMLDRKRMDFLQAITKRHIELQTS